MALYSFKVKNLCDQLEAFGMKNYDAGNLSQIMKGNNVESDGIRQSLLLHHNNPDFVFECKGA